MVVVAVATTTWWLRASVDVWDWRELRFRKPRRHFWNGC